MVFVSRLETAGGGIWFRRCAMRKKKMSREGSGFFPKLIQHINFNQWFRSNGGLIYGSDHTSQFPIS
jgi:hypothetical protein